MQNKLWQYKQAVDLLAGDNVIVLNDGKLEEACIQSIAKKTGNQVRFFRLNVEDIDNYFAGSMCVHNSEGEKSCSPTGDPDDVKARELLSSCGKNPAPAAGCRDTQGEANDAHDEQVKLCGEMGSAKCWMPWVTGQVEDAVKEKVADCPGLSDGDIATLVRAACAAANNCPAPPAPPAPDNACVREDTLIHTPQGLRVVRDLAIGDEVISYDVKGMIDSSDPTWSLWSSDTLEGNASVSVVKSNKNSYWHAWYDVLLSNGAKLSITYEHPVLVKSKGTPTLFASR